MLKLSMSYGYFQLIRFLVAGGLIYLLMIEEDRKNLKIVYILLGLLFQPFFKIALGDWLLVDAFRSKSDRE